MPITKMKVALRAPKADESIFDKAAKAHERKAAFGARILSREGPLWLRISGACVRNPNMEEPAGRQALNYGDLCCAVFWVAAGAGG